MGTRPRRRGARRCALWVSVRAISWTIAAVLQTLYVRVVVVARRISMSSPGSEQKTRKEQLSKSDAPATSKHKQPRRSLRAIAVLPL
eukprot:2841708-Pyramimonas_sp.AAC.1